MGWPYTQNHKPWHTAVSAACNHTATIISQGGKLSSSWHVNVSRSDLFSRVSFWTPGMDWHHRPPCHACKLWWNGVWIQRHALFCVCTLYYCYLGVAWPGGWDADLLALLEPLTSRNNRFPGILQLVKPLPFHISEPYKRYHFRAELPHKDHYRNYRGGGEIQILLLRKCMN